MLNKVEIQIFVSCPGDVESEKQIVEQVCKSLTDSAENYCKISFRVKEWKAIVAPFDGRPQATINEKIGTYDIYLGIWWMRFGSKTGAIDQNTGKEFESGTHEEFVLATDSFRERHSPEIYLFFKEYRAPKSFEVDQLQKLNEFKKSQQPFGWCHDFKNDLDFALQISKLVQQKLFEFCFSQNIEDKKALIQESTIEDFSKNFSSYPPISNYVNRKIIHFDRLPKVKFEYAVEAGSETLQDLVLRTTKIVILGDAGSGKSIELRHLAYRFSEQESPFIPIYQSLNTYTPETGLDGFLPKYWKDVPQRLLLIIWDGLDEIIPKDYNTVVRQIVQFAERYPELRLVVSCRTNFYELPVTNTQGTLPGFEPYFLEDFTKKNIKQYFDLKHDSANSQQFLDEIANQNLSALASKPFFLMVLSDIFEKKASLETNRGNLFEAFLALRIVLDETHYKTTIDIRIRKKQIVELLKRTALAMEILAKNYISESELLSVLSLEEFELIKYCTAFKKKEGEETIWQFEHNNIQEFLAAKALSSLSFDGVLNFIAFEPDHNRLIPSWTNTLTFLFSILDSKSQLFDKLLTWLISTDKEIIVKFEKSKLADTIRSDIFKRIFAYYKQHDIWINSNKFSDKELADFAQSETSFTFLNSEINNSSTTRTTKLNAIGILGYFNLTDDQKRVVENVFLELIQTYHDDPYFIFSTIHALNHSKIASHDVVSKLMTVLGTRKNQYIRAAIYSILVQAKAVEAYVDYLIEGLGLEDSQHIERDDVSLFDEGWSLREAIGEIKSPTNLKKLLDYVSNNEHFHSSHSDLELWEKLIANSVIAYKHDETILNYMVEILVKNVRQFRNERLEIVISFFDKTNTRKKAFAIIWGMTDVKGEFKLTTLAKLATEPEIEFILSEYKTHNTTNDVVRRLYFEMTWAKNPHAESFGVLVRSQTSANIDQPAQIEYNQTWQTTVQQNFDLLFDRDTFLKGVLKIFDDFNKNELTTENLHEIRRNGALLDDQYPTAVLRLLRDLSRRSSQTTRDEVVQWFNKIETVEWYCTNIIHEHLVHNNQIKISPTQKLWIENWTKLNAKEVNFKQAISQDENGNISTNRKAILVAFFTKKLDIPHPNDVLLDMLSFDFFEGHVWVGIKHITDRLPEKDVTERILQNFKEGLKSNFVLKNHVVYAIEKKLTVAYEFILAELTNKKRESYFRIGLLKTYFNGTNDAQGIARILPNVDTEVKWSIIEILSDTAMKHIAEEHLIELLGAPLTNDDKLNIAKHLIKLQNLSGLRLLVEIIETESSDQTPNLNYLKDPQAVPYLMKLLDMSYHETRKSDNFESLNSIVLGSLTSLALISDENFSIVIQSLRSFLSSNEKKYKNINYLRPTIDKIENQFYMNKSQKYTLSEAVSKLASLKTSD